MTWSTRWRSALALFAALAVTVAGGREAAAQKGKPTPPPPTPNIWYEYVSLGPGGANGMNDLGDVVGVSKVVVDGRTEDRAFVATVDDVTGEYVLEDLNGWINPNSGVVLTYAGDINNFGQIAGSALFDVDGTPVKRACRLTPWNVDADGYVVVEVLGVEGVAEAINDHGDIAGRLLSYKGNPVGVTADVFLYTDEAGVIRLYDFASGSNQGWSEYPISINNAAQVAGGSWTRDSEGWRFTPHFDANGMIDGGVMQSLGVIKANRGGIQQASGLDINDAGEVVGGSTAGVRDTHAYRYSDGVGLVDLGALAAGDSLSGARSEAFGINNLGEVVGRDRLAARAFLYTDTFKMFELDSRINGLPDQWFGRLWPIRINAYGDICGNTGNSEWSTLGEAFVLRRVAP